MLLNFYVQGSEPGSSTNEASESYIDFVAHWMQKRISNLTDMTFDDMVDETKARALRAAENCKSLFRFLSGESALSTPPPLHPSYEPAADEKKDESVLLNLMTLFVGLKGARRQGLSNVVDSSDRRVYTDGEVRVDCILVSLSSVQTQCLLIVYLSE
jgi:hypothetical protein